MLLNKKIFGALKYRANFSFPLTYWILVITRFILTSLPQHGYIHPDEFFQNMEVISSDIFLVNADRTWEFNTTFPIRNIFIPKITFGPPYLLIKILNPFTKYYLNIDLRCPYYLLVLPRLFFCLLSLVSDYCLYKICLAYGQNYKTRLKLFASSYVVIIFYCRSFSNSIEAILFSLLIMIVAKCMVKSDRVIYHEEFINDKYKQAKTPTEKVKLFKLKTHLPEHSLDYALLMSTITVVGVFNRPTFIAFAMPPLFFWLNRGLGSKVISFLHFHQRIFLLTIYAVPSILTLIIIDSIYYGYFTLAELESLKVTMNNYVVTPLNFLRYNLNKDNLAKHGLHPHWLHFSVNIPLLFNIIGICGLVNIATLALRFWRGQYKNLPRIQSISGLMLFSFVVPTAILSIFPHQEARFIIPILLPLIFLYGNQIQASDADSMKIRYLKKVLLGLWYIINFLMVIFFGFIHQGGIYPLTNSYYKEVKSSFSTEMHLFTSHTYSIPTSLLQIDSTSKNWYNRASGHKYKLKQHHFFHEHGSMDLNTLLHIINSQINVCEENLKKNKKKYKIYLAIPCSLEESLKDVAANFTKISFYKESHFYPHLSTEAFPTFPSMSDNCFSHSATFEYESPHKKMNLLSRFICFLSKFCLNFYRVEFIH